MTMFDYEEHDKFLESTKDVQHDERIKLYEKKYGGLPHFCLLCGVYIKTLWLHCDGCRCEDCYEFWDKSEKMDLELLLKRAKTEKAKKCWQYYIDERKNK